MEEREEVRFGVHDVCVRVWVGGEFAVEVEDEAEGFHCFEYRVVRVVRL